MFFYVHSFFFIAFFYTTLCAMCVHMTSSGFIDTCVTPSHNLFATKIFKILAELHKHENLILSPASIQAAMALAYLGAEGATAQEIQKGLQLGVGDKKAIIKKYGEFLKANFNNKNPGAEVKMANAIFLDDTFKLSSKIERLARQSFNSTARSLHFADSEESVDIINEWVESNTNRKIKDLLKKGSVNGATQAVLVNALYLKGKWAVPFLKALTKKEQFFLNPTERVEVDMMSKSARYKYGEFNDLDATVLEMNYGNSDLKMMIFLPNDVNGLSALEQKLDNIDVEKDVSAKLNSEFLKVNLPKFKIEFGIDMKCPLTKLGVTKLFSYNAAISFTESKAKQKISQLQHRAYLEVNEDGVEAAAATGIGLVQTSAVYNPKRFNVNHPFVFVIRNREAVFFIGHVTKF